MPQARVKGRGWAEDRQVRSLLWQPEANPLGRPFCFSFHVLFLTGQSFLPETKHCNSHHMERATAEARSFTLQMTSLSSWFFVAWNFNTLFFLYIFCKTHGVTHTSTHDICHWHQSLIQNGFIIRTVKLNRAQTVLFFSFSNTSAFTHFLG